MNVSLNMIFNVAKIDIKHIVMYFDPNKPNPNQPHGKMTGNTAFKFYCQYTQQEFQSKFPNATPQQLCKIQSEAWKNYPDKKQFKNYVKQGMVVQAPPVFNNMMNYQYMNQNVPMQPQHMPQMPQQQMQGNVINMEPKEKKRRGRRKHKEDPDHEEYDPSGTKITVQPQVINSPHVMGIAQQNPNQQKPKNPEVPNPMVNPNIEQAPEAITKAEETRKLKKNLEFSLNMCAKSSSFDVYNFAMYPMNTPLSMLQK